VAAAQRALGHVFTDGALLAQALVHPSTADRDGAAGFERLEFLGDRVIGLVVADMLHARFPHEREGSLALRHTALVRRETLAALALDSGLADCLSGAFDGAGQASTFADGFEAAMGALYCDGGLEAARRFLTTQLAPQIEQVGLPQRDAKTALQETVQATGGALPRYAVVDRTGPPHAPTFRVRVSLVDGAQGEGTGSSKRQAEQAAAESLLMVLEARQDRGEV